MQLPFVYDLNTQPDTHSIEVSKAFAIVKFLSFL